MREPTWFSWTRRIGLTVLAVFAGLPIWVMVTSALKPLGDVQGDFRWFPTQLTVQPFFDMWHTIPLAEYFVNSIVVSTVASLASVGVCLLYTSPSPRDRTRSRMP